MKRLAPTRAAPALAVLALAAAAPLAAQSVRIHSTTTARYVQLRPVLYDAAAGAYVPQAVEAATPVTQDLEVNAWGVGVSGLRFYGLLRLRGSLGSDLVWPRYGDHFDALAAYAEYEHANYRLRLGRQQKASMLGWYGYDGLSASIRPIPRVRVEAYGGLGLARGYLEPVNSGALSALDPFTPEKGTYLFGASVTAAPTPTSRFSAIYQREILTDKSGLVSERVALDGTMSLTSFLEVTGTSEFDLATNEWGKARGSAIVHLGRWANLEGEAFRYVPTIDLTTIWGVFGPESHWGYTGRIHFMPGRGFRVWGGYTERRYEAETGYTPFGYDLPDRSQEVSAGAHLGAGTVALDGTYRLQREFGGEQSGGDAHFSFAPAAGWRAGLKGTAFQRDGEFRVADGTVYGAGIEARGRLLGRFDVRADVMRFYQRKQERRPSTLTGLDWNQTRASLTVDWTFGTNPDRGGSR
jgi:hypothetical protein